MVNKSGGSSLAALKTAIVPFGLWGLQRLARKKHNRRSIKRVGKRAKGVTRKTVGFTKRTLKSILKLPLNTLRKVSKIPLNTLKSASKMVRKTKKRKRRKSSRKRR